MDLIFKTDGGDIGKIGLPYHPSEVTFEGFCDFKTDEAKYLNLELDHLERTPYIQKCLSHVITGDLDKIQPFTGHDEDLDKLIEVGYTIKQGDHISHLRLYAHFVNVVRYYKSETVPSTFKFILLKHAYIVESKPAIRVLLNKPITTGEALEVLEYQRRAKSRMEVDHLEMGNLDFNLGLSEMAILVKREGEQLPSSKGKRQKFINSRKQIFKTIPLDIVLDLRFFLLSSLINYAMTPITHSSGKVRQVAVAYPNLRRPVYLDREQRRHGKL